MKIGILGAGNIADVVAPTIAAVKEAECYAVAARSLERAEAFAVKHGFAKAYGSYEELVKDEEVELIYVTTPHSHHYEHIMLCLQHGKAVICEKAFTMNANQAKEVFAYAKEHGIYVAEAIWTRYMPSRKLINEILESGVIGTPATLTANLSYIIRKKERIVNPMLAGGALLDVGVYGINFATMHFGEEIERVESSVQLTDTGVDGMESITIFYKNGRMAVLTHGIYARSDRKGIIHGDKGYLVVENINNPQSVTVFDTADKMVAHYEVPKQISGYEYEFEEAIRCMKEGKIESDSMPFADSVWVMEFMDRLRKQWGVIYPQEKE